MAGGINRHVQEDLRYKVHFSEILDPLSNDGWKLGPKLSPGNDSVFENVLWDTTMVTSPDEKGVIIFGGKVGHLSNGRTVEMSAVYELRQKNSSLKKKSKVLEFEWKDVKFDSKPNRIKLANRLAFSIPNDFTNKEQNDIRSITNPEVSQCIIKKNKRDARQIAKEIEKRKRPRKRYSKRVFKYRRSERIKGKNSDA